MVVVVGHTMARTALVLMGVEEVALERKSLMQIMVLIIAVVEAVEAAGRGQGLLKMVVMEAQALFTYPTLIL